MDLKALKPGQVQSYNKRMNWAEPQQQLRLLDSSLTLWVSVSLRETVRIQWIEADTKMVEFRKRSMLDEGVGLDNIFANYEDKDWGLPTGP